jgi:hypothetical protein
MFINSTSVFYRKNLGFTVKIYNSDFVFGIPYTKKHGITQKFRGISRNETVENSAGFRGVPRT